MIQKQQSSHLLSEFLKRVNSVVLKKEEKKRNVYVSSGEMKALAVLITAKIFFTGTKKMIDVYFVEDKENTISISGKEYEKIKNIMDEVIKQIDKVISYYSNKDKKSMKKSQKYSTAVMGRILSDNLISFPVSPMMLGFTLLYSYFIEGSGKKAVDVFSFFKDPNLYDEMFKVYDITEAIDFIRDQEVCLKGLLEL